VFGALSSAGAVVSNTILSEDVDHAMNSLKEGQVTILSITEDALLRPKVKEAFGDSWPEIRQFLLEDLGLDVRSVSALSRALIDIPKARFDTLKSVYIILFKNFIY